MALSFVRIIPSNTKWKFVRLRKIAFAISMAAILAAIVGFFMFGINLGIDFKGGGNIEISTSENADLPKIRSIVNGLGLGHVEVREFGSPKEILIRFERQESNDPDVNEERLQQTAGRSVHLALYEQYSDLSIQLDGPNRAIIKSAQQLDLAKGRTALDELGVAGLSLSAGENEKQAFLALPIPSEASNDSGEQQQLFEEVRYKLLETFSPVTSERTEIVGPKVSGELVRSGTIAVLGALFCMLVYIWLRFEWQFSVGAVAALSHDVVLTIGMFALTRIEFNLASIAAILTIVGYSMNDTVVVYDRIREKLRKYKKMVLPELLDMAINKTLARTSITSLTTMLALVSLYFLGGEALKGFAFTMIWGVLIGTYSSIFIASPILLSLGIDRESIEGDS